MNNNNGFLFRVRICNLAKSLVDKMSVEYVTIPHIMDLLFPDGIKGKDRERLYQRITMFLRELCNDGLAEKSDDGEFGTYYNIDFKIISI